MNTRTSDATAKMAPKHYAMVQKRQQAGQIGHYSTSNVDTAPGGEDIEILLAVCTWEHVYLRDWGVAGKRAFLERWWDCIDWQIVENKIGSSHGSHGKSSQFL